MEIIIENKFNFYHHGSLSHGDVLNNICAPQCGIAPNDVMHDKIHVVVKLFAKSHVVVKLFAKYFVVYGAVQFNFPKIIESS